MPKHKTLTSQQLDKFLIDLYYKQGGILTPEIVVDAARPATSPIHDRFEWDDLEAAERFRLRQAQQLLKQSKYEIMVSPSKAIPKPTNLPIQVRRFHGLDTKGHRDKGYVAITDIQQDQALEREYLTVMERALRALFHKYCHSPKFWELIETLKQEYKTQLTSK